MINLSIKIIRSGIDLVSISSSLYLLIASTTGVNTPFQSFVGYPLLFIGVASLGYFAHSKLTLLARKFAGYQLKFVKTQHGSIHKQPIAQ